LIPVYPVERRRLIGTFLAALEKYMQEPILSTAAMDNNKKKKSKGEKIMVTTDPLVWVEDNTRYLKFWDHDYPCLSDSRKDTVNCLPVPIESQSQKLLIDKRRKTIRVNRA
jgi:hypothetical protein